MGCGRKLPADDNDLEGRTFLHSAHDRLGLAAAVLSAACTPTMASMTSNRREPTEMRATADEDEESVVTWICFCARRS